MDYPKCLYKLDDSTRIVTDAAEEKAAVKEGWLLHADYYAKKHADEKKASKSKSE